MPAPQAPSSSRPASQRLDAWLWFARFRRSRADCVRLIEAGAVRINRRPVDKPATPVRAGDVLTLALQADRIATLPPLGAAPRESPVIVVRVTALGLRRGPAAEARTLYDEVADGGHGA